MEILGQYTSDEGRKESLDEPLLLEDQTQSLELVLVEEPFPRPNSRNDGDTTFSALVILYNRGEKKVKSSRQLSRKRKRRVKTRERASTDPTSTEPSPTFRSFARIRQTCSLKGAMTPMSDGLRGGEQALDSSRSD